MIHTNHLILAFLFAWLSAIHTVAFAQSPPASDDLAERVAILERERENVLTKISGPVLAAVVSAFVSYAIFVWNAGRKERRQRAVDLLNEFMTSETYLKARLVIQQYCMPTGSKYHKSLDSSGNLLNLSALTVVLESGDANDQQARIYIRAIPSFFWLVDQARDAGYIGWNEELFVRHYTWYWVHILRFRLSGCSDHRLFRQIDWLITKKERLECEREFNTLIATLSSEDQRMWNIASSPTLSSS